MLLGHGMALHHMATVHLETSGDPILTLISVRTTLALIGSHGKPASCLHITGSEGKRSRHGRRYLWRLSLRQALK
jgi:hypothetical protein